MSAPARTPGTGPEEAEDHRDRARLLLLLGAVALLVSLLLGWDGGVGDQLTAEEVVTARRSGVLRAFDAEPSTPFALLVPFGVALLGLVAFTITVAVRGVAGRAEAIVLGGALVCALSFVVRQVLDDAPGVAEGSLLATAGLLVALPAATRLPSPAPERAPGWPVLALGLVSAALLTGMVHDAYASVDLDQSVLGGYGVDEDAGWPETWLAAPVGARTRVDALLVLVASGGCVAAVLAAAGRFARPAGAGLAVLAGATFLGLLVLALGPNPGVSGVDRFPYALGPLLALLVLLPLALRAHATPTAIADAPREPAAPAPPRRIAPPEAWAHPSERPRGWWS